MIDRCLLVLALLCLPLGLRAERIDQLPSPLPASYVSDAKGLLAADTRAELDRLAARLDDGHRGQLAIAVVANTGGIDPRRFATDLLNRWGVGDRKRNDGTLILLAREDRAAEIVLGDGIDTAANRSHTEAVMQEQMVPRFRDGDYDQALIAGSTALLQRIYALDLSRPAEQSTPDAAAALAATPDARAPMVDYATGERPASNDQPAASTTDADPATQPAATPTPFDGDAAIGLGLLAALAGAGYWLLSRLLRLLWWFTGSRWFVRRCGACKAAMMQLSEADDDAHLNPAERTEERLGSVDHRVFLCSACGKVESLARRAWFTRYSDCVACHSRALSRVSKTLSAATRYSTGLAEVTETCQHCGKVKTERRVLPVLPPPSSSSSSSGGRSFGGGRSSGGGASGRW